MARQQARFLRGAALLIALAAVLVGPARIGSAQAFERSLRVAYFVPSDRDAAPDYQRRIQRLLEDVQKFFRDEMQANGYGPLTFQLDHDSRGRLKIYEVRAENPAATYVRSAEAKVADEVKAVLRDDGVDMDKETVIIFQRLMDWKDGKTVEIGPYKGGGSGGRGTAWVYDDPHLDVALLSSKESGGWCPGPGRCTWGQFNGLYVGGIAHELGHALGLPHLAETKEQRAEFGPSLMSSGNRTYRRDLWGDGPGSFLAPASAVLLAHHPLFTGSANVSGEGNFRLSNLRFDTADGGLRITGRVVGAPAFAIVARNDDTAIADDYDAVGWSTDVEDDGRFDLQIGELRATRYDLSLTVAGDDGRVKTMRFQYAVDGNGRIDTDQLQSNALLGDADMAFAARDRAALKRIAGQIGDRGQDAVARVEHLLSLLDQPQPIALAAIHRNQTRVDVSTLAFTNARTGYGPPLRDQVRIEGGLTARIEVGGQFHALGLYAHAPALHEVDANGQWNVLRTGYGLQDGHSGSVVFVVRGDGRDLFRSSVVRDHEARWAEIDISGVNTLQLLTENANDGTAGDWGVWLEPILKR